MKFDNHTYPYSLFASESLSTLSPLQNKKEEIKEDILFLCLSDYALPQKLIFKRLEKYAAEVKNTKRPIKLAVYLWHYSERFNAFHYLSEFLDVLEQHSLEVEHLSFKHFKELNWGSAQRLIDLTKKEVQTPLYLSLSNKGTEIYQWREHE